MNLTKTTIASYLKYIRASNEDASVFKSEAFSKKCGFFVTETHLIHDVWKKFGFSLPQRFPLAYIMEAADDIAYCISDIEDSIEKGLLVERLALTDIYKEWGLKKDATCTVSMSLDTPLKAAALGHNEAGNEFTYTDFRTSVTRILVKYAASRFIEKHDEILRGELESLLPKESGAGIVLDIFKSYCRNKVYCHESVQRIELAGYSAIYGLLEKFKCLLDCSEPRFLSALKNLNKDDLGFPIVVEKKLLSLFPKKYIKVYLQHVSVLNKLDTDYRFREWNARAHLVVDFVSGMTDDFAMKTFRELSGVQL